MSVGLVPVACVWTGGYGSWGTHGSAVFTDKDIQSSDSMPSLTRLLKAVVPYELLSGRAGMYWEKPESYCKFPCSFGWKTIAAISEKTVINRNDLPDSVLVTCRSSA